MNITHEHLVKIQRKTPEDYKPNPDPEKDCLRCQRFHCMETVLDGLWGVCISMVSPKRATLVYGTQYCDYQES